MRVVFPWPQSQLNPNVRLHWAIKHKAKKVYRQACYLLTRQVMQKNCWEVPDTRVIKLTISFYPPDARRRDDDNMIGSFKSGRDGMADALGVNDFRFDPDYKFYRDDHRGCVVVELP